MTFENYEITRARGAPADLYLFRYGEQDPSYLAYTDALRPVVFHDPVYDQDVTFEPVAISRDSIKSSGSLDKAVMKITAPMDLSIGSFFRIYPPSRVVTLTIFQGHLDDPDSDYLVQWAGRLTSFEREGSNAVMGAEPVSTSLRRAGLRRHYQIMCPHYLYGDDCRASRTAATVPGVVASMSGHTVTLVGGWNPNPLVKYRQGEFRWTLDSGEVEIRQIIRVTAPNTLTLSGALVGLSNGDAVEVSLGCNHTTSKLGEGDGDCVNLHFQADEVTPNGPNFGGCKFIPKKNPIGFVNLFE